jgi:hypothetical protein
MDYNLCTFVTTIAILVLQLNDIRNKNWDSSTSWDTFKDDYSDTRISAPKTIQVNGIRIYEHAYLPHPSYISVSPEGEFQIPLDMDFELMKLRIAANTQRNILTLAGRMPPETPVSKMIAEQTRKYIAEDEARQDPPQISSTSMGSYSSPTDGNPQGTGKLDSLKDFLSWINVSYHNRVGVVLEVGRGDVAIHLLNAWKSTHLYLVDPYIHMFDRVEDKNNAENGQQQKNFENLRSALRPYEGRFTFIRDFSFECMTNNFLLIYISLVAKTYRAAVNQPAPGVVWLNTIHSAKAVTLELSVWWEILAVGGVLVGHGYDNSIMEAVLKFAKNKNLVFSSFQANELGEIWFIVKN